MRRTKVTCTAVLAAALLLSSCSAQEPPVVEPGGAAPDTEVVADPFASATTIAHVLDVVRTLEVSPDELDALLLERALRERGPLVHYGGIEAAVLEAWSAGFAAAYPGLGHTAIRLRSTELIERARVERDAGVLQVDLFDSTDTGLLALTDADLTALGVDVLAPEGLPERYRSPSAVTFSIQPLVIVWNTDLIDAAAAPQSWDDFLLPAHAGCVIVDSPSLLVGLLHQRGLEAAERWIDGFLANGGRVVRGNSAAVAAIASGEFPCAVAGTLSTVEELAAKGAPLEWHAPDPTPYLTYAIGIAAATPKPYTAALFFRWALGPQGAVALVANDRLSTRPDSPVASPRARSFTESDGSLSARLLRPDPARERENAQLALDLLDRKVLPASGG
jgi:ABC-type Fe3+ transport system substrate-binding protein